MKKYVVIAGNIGVGKSTLVNLLCRKLKWEPFFEPVAENPYLVDFYKDMAAWAFHSQIFFLTHRLRAQHQIANHPTSIIQDRSVYEDAEIFAKNLYLQGFIQSRDFATYRDLYETVMQLLPPPDLVIYLRASVSTLSKRILRRGREYERSITPEYLGSLNSLYEEWIAKFTLCPVLTVPADAVDYVAHHGHLGLIVQKIDEKLTGREEVIFDAEEVARAAEE
jgi:deoxyadenosine/deoxycytidine kinase